MYQSTNNPDLENGNYYHSQIPGSGKEMISGISTVNVRHGFIRKVYSILFIQLAITVGIAAPFVLLDSSVIRPFIRENLWLMWVSLAVSFTTMIIFACFPSLMRQYPLNYAILLLFTVTQGFFVGMISSQYEVQSVVIALATVTAIALALTLFAFQTKIDFTGMGPYLLVGTLVILIFGFILIFFPGNSIAQKIYCGLGALLFSLYLVYDTQLIVGGNHRKHQFSIDDYAVAAICLYIDIIQLFLFMLSLFGDRR
jgi:FtsH-binding integral membrane protein